MDESGVTEDKKKKNGADAHCRVRPGKVFLAGGYLVLDRAYTALVFGLSARISVVAREIETSQGVQLQEIVVTSPQFQDSQWRYGYHLLPDGAGIKVTQLHAGSSINPNPFVETTLTYALTYIASVSPSRHRSAFSLDPVHLTVLADNDYYSQPHTIPHTEKNPTRFSKFPTPLKDANKTGLGSSAALVTSLTASLLTHYLPAELFAIESDEGRRVLHNLAQAAHCAAQGKPRHPEGPARARRQGLRPAVVDLVTSEKTWDTEVSKEGVRVPPGMAIRMCDVDCGSQTVGMVKQVLAWKASAPEQSKQLWDSLQAKNEALGRILAEDRKDEIKPAVDAIRELIRAMGVESGVPIEPESQTALLDALVAEIDGVYNGVVPGAGGFDALALLMRDDEETETKVKEFVKAWGKEHGGMVRLLDVKGEMEGVRKETLGQYDGWLN
ncbi:hypothetical protein PG987_010668 [Apiospora arundinis]